MFREQIFSSFFLVCITKYTDYKCVIWLIFQDVNPLSTHDAGRKGEHQQPSEASHEPSPWTAGLSPRRHDFPGRECTVSFFF